MFFSRPAGHKVVHRGNPDSYDFTQGDFIVDSIFHDLDLSGIIPKNVKLVLLRVRFKSALIGKFIEFQKKGDYSHRNISSLYSQVANVWITGDCFVIPNSDGIIEYAVSTNSSPTINVLVGEWWV